MALSDQVKAAFSGDPKEATILKGTIIARFFDSKDKLAAQKNPYGRWWIYIPGRQISNPNSAIDDIRGICNGLRKDGRKLLAIKEEWSDMKYWSQITLIENIKCYTGVAAPQDILEGGWRQIYFEDSNLTNKYSKQTIQCIEL